MYRRLILSIAIAVMFCGSVFADWPQYLGPNANATVPDAKLARSWPSDGPKVLWTVKLGPGYGAAAISEGRVYVLDRPDREKDVFRCLDLLTGKELWSYSYDAPGKVSHDGSRSVPTVAGDYIYTCGTFGHVHCFDKNTHEVVWQKNVWTDFGGARVPTWGITQHPLVCGDTVILASQTEKAGIVAYDKKTGEVNWFSAKLPGVVGYVSPKLVSIGGVEQLVMITACSRSAAPGGDGRNEVLGAVLGMDPKSGKTLWSYRDYRCRIPIPNVVEIGGDRLFVTGGYKAGSVMLMIEKQGGRFAAKEVYKTDDFGSHNHPPVLYKEHLYGHCTTNTRRDGMVCMSIDGKLKWKTGRQPIVFDKGGFILAGDLIISVDGGIGILNLIEPMPDGFKRLAHAKILDSRECWGPLAYSEGKLVIRDQKQMKCVVVGATR